MTNPSIQHQAQAQLAQHEIVELINRLIVDERMDARAVLSGFGAGVSAAIISLYGSEHVERWFNNWAAMASALRNGV